MPSIDTQADISTCIDTQTDTNIGNKVTEENSSKNTSNVHLILVTTETPELKNWKRQILQEEIKLLRLKQKLIRIKRFKHRIKVVKLMPLTFRDFFFRLPIGPCAFC